MEQIGFGVLVFGKPSGIWPLPWWLAMKKAKVAQINRDFEAVKVVPIFIGAPIEIVTPAPKKDVA